MRARTEVKRRLRIVVKGQNGLPLDMELVQFGRWNWMLTYMQEQTPKHECVTSYAAGGAVWALTAKRALARVFGWRQATVLYAGMTQTYPQPVENPAP